MLKGVVEENLPPAYVGYQQHDAGQGRRCARPSCLPLIPCATDWIQSL